MITIDKEKGYATLTRLRDAIKITDQAARANGMAAKADPEPYLSGALEIGMGLARAANIANQITTRDSLWQRSNLADNYKTMATSLFQGDMAKGVLNTLREAQTLKPEVALTRHRSTVPPLLAELHKRLAGEVAEHATRVESAKARIVHALMPEPATDPGQAATIAIRSMEIRARLERMTPAARVQILDTWARAGDIASLDAVRSDPFGITVPASVMQDAEATALAAIGGQFLADDLADAVAEHEHLEALTLTIFSTAVAELREAGVAESLLTPWRLQKAVADDAANNTTEQ